LNLRTIAAFIVVAMASSLIQTAMHRLRQCRSCTC